MKEFNPDRRKFLKLGVVTAGSSLVIGVNWSCSDQSQKISGARSGAFAPNAWLRIESNGVITIIVAESEMGQGAYTLMPMMVAEELEVDWSLVRVEHASLDPVYGYQVTSGSSSIRKGWTTLREAGAIARTLLINAAAHELAVPIHECKARLGKVIHTDSGREIAYEQLIAAAASLPIPETAHLKPFNEYSIIGKPLPRTDVGSKINGKARFGIDSKFPGMLYATITHSPVFGGKPGKVDDKEAKKIPGVQDVFEIDEGVVVVASDTWSAFKARQSLKIDWDAGEKSGVSTDTIIKGLREGDVEKADIAWEKGNVSGAFSGNDSIIEAEYILPFQAHMTLEPMNCTAHFRADGVLDIWAPTQSPSAAYNAARISSQSKIERGLRKIQKKILGTRDESINVHTTLLGGGHGRRLKQDYVVEAVKIAKRYDKPVQLVWTREEDIQHDHYQPLTFHKMVGVLGLDGIPLAWSHYIAGHDVVASGANPHPYNIANCRVSIQNNLQIIPKGDWRSVALHYNVFAVEHFLDEMAWAGKKDPVELRMQLLDKQPRLRKVLEMAADITNWSGKSSQSVTLGVALIAHWGSHIAQVVELMEIGESKFKVSKVTCVIDCGIVINPDIVKQQMEGSIIFGLTAAIKSKISIKNGMVEQSNYNDYPVLRMHETPDIEVLIVNSEEEPGGIGEPGVPPLAPALANALLMATGNPVRDFPIKLV